LNGSTKKAKRTATIAAGRIETGKVTLINSQMHDTYLTIDLDFWNDRELDLYWLNTVASLKFAVKYAVEYHHHILPHVNQANTRRIINVDFHSDITEDAEQMILECGTWGNFVSWADNGSFLWIFPSEKCVQGGFFKTDTREAIGRYKPLQGFGTCHSVKSPFSQRNRYTKWPLGKCNRRLEPNPKIDLSRVAFVAFCTSPDYRHIELDAPWNEFLGKHNIAWIKTEKENTMPTLDQWAGHRLLK
jgi:hypothetical protein